MVKQKNKAHLQQISDVAWLVSQGPRKVGILNRDVQDKYFYINGKQIVKLGDEEDVGEYFSNVNIFKEQDTVSPVVEDDFFIKGYIVDYPTPYPLDVTHEDYNPEVPLYTKTPESDVYYAAGWYCINFEKGWKHSHGPKYSTLVTYGYAGPFKTEQECRSVNSKLNKQKKQNERS